MRASDRRPRVSISRWEPVSAFGDVGPGGKVIGVGGIDLPAGPPADGQIAVYDAGLGAWTWVGAPLEDAEGTLAIRYAFSTTTTDSDPGPGIFRLSNATQYLAVTARCDLLDASGYDVTAILDAIADQTGTTKGYLRLQKTDDPTKWLLATVSAIATPGGGGYRNITIGNIAKSSTSPFASGDLVTLSWVPSTVGLAAASALGAYQPLDSDLTAIAALTPSNDDVIQRKAGAWTNRTIAQLMADMPTATVGLAGLLPPISGDVNDVLRGDRSWGHPTVVATTVITGIGCVVFHSATQNVANTGATEMLMDSEDLDTSGFHFTSAANLTGTVAKTAGLATIVGTGTTFTTELAVNQVISIPGTATEYGSVASIADNTHLTLNQVMANTAAGQTAKRRSEYMSIPAGLAGAYEARGGTSFASNANGYRQVVIQKNSFTFTANTRARTLVQSGNGAQTVISTPSILLDLVPGDLLGFWASHNSTTTPLACGSVAIAGDQTHTQLRFVATTL